MKASLVVAQGSNQGREIPLTRSPFVIGRDPQCHLRPVSPAISRRHCALLLREGRLFIQDFGSTNGTLLNGQRIREEAELRAGDQLQIDRLVFNVQIEAPPLEAAPSNGDDDAIAALLLDLQNGEPPVQLTDSPAAEAASPDATTVLNAVPPPSLANEPQAASETPVKDDKGKSKAEPGTTAHAAKLLLAKYKLQRKRS